MAGRFYLHVKDHDHLAEDPEGVEFADLASAHAQAVAGGREILAERLLTGQPLDGLRIVICDKEGGFLEQLCFDDFVRLGR
jgi:hypothetical protein